MTKTTTLADIGAGSIEAVAADEPGWLSQSRRKALEKYLALPAEVSPLYSKYSDANKVNPQGVHFAFSKDAAARHEGDNGKLNADLQKRLEELEKEQAGILQVGAGTSRVFVSDSLAKQGVIVADIREAIATHGDLVKAHADANPISFEEDKYMALEAAAFQTGAFVYVPRNAVVEEPIRIIMSLGDDGTSLVSRNIFVAEAGAKATIVQEVYAPGTAGDSGGGGGQQGYFELVESSVKPGAHLEAVTLQAMSPDTIYMSNRKAFVERDAKMSWYTGMFGAMLSRCRTDSHMNGSGASAEDIEIVFGAGSQSFDVTSNLVHDGPHSRGRVQVKSVLKDTSKSLFKGMIKIGKNGKGTESYLAGHAILLDKGAKSDSIPGLEILTNEVKATHSASVAQMDEGQIYYLMTRGLSREGAKREIVSGFLEPLSRRMGPTIRAWVNYLIENKWQGRSLMLRTDEAMEQILEVEKSRYRETQDIFEKHYKYRQ